MAKAQYHLLFKEEHTRGPVLQHTYGGEEQVEVSEITTRAHLLLCARDVSLYRHTLLIDNKRYDILNVFLQPDCRHMPR